MSNEREAVFEARFDETKTYEIGYAVYHILYFSFCQIFEQRGRSYGGEECAYVDKYFRLFIFEYGTLVLVY